MLLKKIIFKFLNRKGYKIVRYSLSDKLNAKLKAVYDKYRDFTMITERSYIINLELAEKYVREIDGDIVECGVWKGGMIAGIAEILGNSRTYYLFDSFEGLPEVEEIDGSAAKKWQQNVSGDTYHDNCRATMQDAETAMKQANCKYKLIRGWFNETLPQFDLPGKIALLRLDADWYQSTMDCLKNLYPKLADKGLLLIDDYFAWEGCSKAVHDYLSEIRSTSVIRTYGSVCYIVKTENGRG